MSLSAFFEVASQDQQTINTSLANDLLIIVESSNQKIRFGNASNSGTEYMVIHSNIGIGTTNPIQKFAVIGEGYFSSNLIINNSNLFVNTTTGYV